MPRIFGLITIFSKNKEKQYHWMRLCSAPLSIDYRTTRSNKSGQRKKGDPFESPQSLNSMYLVGIISNTTREVNLWIL